MKPFPIVLAVLALVLGWSLVNRSQPSRAYKDPLDINEFPSRFNDPIQSPRAATKAERMQVAARTAEPPAGQPVHAAPTSAPANIAPPNPRVPSQFTEAWQATALNEGLGLVLAQQLQMYSTQAIRGKIYYDPREYPSNFIPKVPGFEFVRSPPPHHGANFNGPDFLMHLTGWRAERAESTNRLWSHLGQPVAHFSLSPRGVHGFSSVGLDVSLGVFKGSNGFTTHVLMAIDP